MMKGGVKNSDKFISQDDYDAYIDGEISIDDKYNNYLSSIEDADYISERENVVKNPEGILYLTANST